MTKNKMTADKKQSRYAWMAYTAICIMSVMWVGIQYNCMNLYAAPVVEYMGITRTQFMVVISIPGIISALVSLLCFGAIEERFGMRKMLLIGGILNTLAFVCWVFMDSIALLYLGGVLYGFGCSITAYNSVAAGVNRWFKRRMGSLMGAANALGNVAGIVFAMVIAALIASLGWRYSFGVCVALSMVSTVVCVALYKGNPEDVGVSAMYADEQQEGAAPAFEAGGQTDDESPMSAPVMPKIPFHAALRMPRMWMLAIGYLILGTTTCALMSTLPLFAVDQGFEQLQGQVVSASLFAAAAMMVPLGMVCDRLGVKWGLALCILLMAIAAFLLRMGGLSIAGMLAVAICAGAAYSSCGVTVGTGVKEAFGDFEFSKKLGVCSGCMYIGLAFGPALINLVYDTTGSYALALHAFLVLAVVMVLMFFAGLHDKAARR